MTPMRVLRGGSRRIIKLLARGRDAVLLPLAAASPMFSSFVYAAASRAFDREHRAVALGRRRFAEMDRQLAEHSYLLRRNVHMLEKGLVMRPRRPVFAVDYIAPTVKVYREMLRVAREEPDRVDPRELRWAGDVLATYFDVTGSHPTIDKVRGWWNDLDVPVNSPNELLIPYRRDTEQDPPVGLDALQQLARRRRSVRWFDPRPIDREIIDRALEVALEAPSACNRQPFEFRIFDEPHDVQRVAQIPMGTRGFAQNFPAIAVLVGQMDAFFDERDRHLIYIDGSLAAMSFILALEAAGLASCIINWPDIASEERAMAQAIGLQPHERVVMLIAFGHPDPTAMVPASGKKSIERFRRYES